MLELTPGPGARPLNIPLEELAHLVSGSASPSEKLNSLVLMIRQQFHSDVCSVYLLETSRTHLMLAATVGLSADGVGKVRLNIKEGLVGLVAEQAKPLAVADAHRHPRFKYIPEIGEEMFRTFLGVPLMDRGVLQGVLVVQSAESRDLPPEELDTLQRTGQQVTSLISQLRAQEQITAPAFSRTRSLARNLWWSWDADSNSLFHDLSPTRWRTTSHNPVAVLSQLSLEELESQATELGLHSRIHYAYRRLQEYRSSTRTWGARHAGVLWARPVAYFSAEFGLHESVPIFSGGLGILAGDHLKSASDLGIPLVGVGLFYAKGYFRQRIDIHGQQHEEYITNDPGQLPLELATGPNGQPLTVSVDTRMGAVQARVWKLQVGRNTLVLLDSNLDHNRAEDRDLTAHLYGGDRRMRIRQELLLGVGGVKALRALGISPGVLHLNEGHSAFATLEVVHQRMVSEGIDFEEAVRRVARNTVFTTHTPVPAGHDRFSAELIEEHLGPLRDQLHISHDHLMSLGRVEPYNLGEEFCMTVLALKLSRRANAVSSLHGEVSRNMWNCLFPGRNEEQVPIGHITNGVHVLTWLAPQMQKLYDRHLNLEWPRRTGEPQTWEPIEAVDDGEVWETHQSLKTQLIDFVRRRAVREAERRGDPPEFIKTLGRALSLDTLTIGFARRFATYKRADMAFRDVEAMAALVNDAQRPIQFVFAGKAHPHDTPGKELIRRIADLTRDPQFAGKVVFIEDYDINTCRHFVQGVDVWLNNPRRPLEASGTSGQKVVLNGGLNLSILDGWWAEAYEGNNGFAIGGGETHVSPEIHDARDAAALLSVLRNQVVPMYYDRDQDGLPRAWVTFMKRAIRTLGWRFSADRMVMDYVTKCYVPAAGGTSSDMSRMLTSPL